MANDPKNPGNPHYQNVPPADAPDTQLEDPLETDLDDEESADEFNDDESERQSNREELEVDPDRIEDEPGNR